MFETLERSQIDFDQLCDSAYRSEVIAKGARERGGWKELLFVLISFTGSAWYRVESHWYAPDGVLCRGDKSFGLAKLADAIEFYNSL